MDKEANRGNSDIWIVPTAGGEPRRLTSAPGDRQHPALVARRQDDRLHLHPVRRPPDLDDQSGRRRSLAGRRPSRPARPGSSGPRRQEPGLRLLGLPRRHGRRGQQEDGRGGREEQGQRPRLRHALLPLLERLARRDAQPRLRRPRPRAARPWTSPRAISTRRRSTWAGTTITPSPPTAGRSPSSATSIPISTMGIGTNNDVFITPAAGGPITAITTNKANDNQPSYSPDGKYLAYKAMARPGLRVRQAGPDALRPGGEDDRQPDQAGRRLGGRDVLGAGRVGRLFQHRRERAATPSTRSPSRPERSSGSWAAGRSPASASCPTARPSSCSSRP